MAQFDDRVLEEIKARVDLADLVSSYGVHVVRAGSGVKACCPFHNEKTPSFHINTAKGLYHCFGCGESGDAIKFVMKQDGSTFVEAVEKLAGICGMTLERREDPERGRRERLLALMAELAQFYHRCLGRMREAEIAREYLAKRGLDAKTQDDFLIGYAPNGISPVEKWAAKYGYSMEEMEAAGVVKAPSRPGDRGYHRFGGRLMFSIRDRQGRVVAFSGRQLVEKKNSGKYVNSPETLIFRKSSVLFGFDRAAANIAKSPHREAIVCEGQIDAIRLHICGFPVAVASQGTAFTEEHARMLKRVADAVVLVFDDDAAGHKATVRTAAMLLAAEIPVRVVSLPDGDDPDSFLRAKGADAFRKLLDGAESVVSFQCRVETAKERDPRSIDAVARISRAVVATIAACPSAILRASLADEAARILGLPSAAVAEELDRARESAKAAASVRGARSPASPGGGEGGLSPAGSGVDADVDDGFPDEMPGEDAGAAGPPPPREMAFMSFLLANEHDAALEPVVGELLPGDVFAHGFTRGFVEAWRCAVAGGDDVMPEYAERLPARERGWFDDVLLAAGRAGASSLAPGEILEDYVRELWRDCLRRRRGALPAAGGPDVDVERLKISTDLKRLNMVKWRDVKDMVRQMIKGEKRR